MLAKRIPTILPPMSLDEGIETTRIHSVAGVLEDSLSLVGTRPYRSPHHTISDAGLIGGAVPRPGEVSLGHNGVLFLDELPEFQRNVLEVMRQPLEDGAVTNLSRSRLRHFPLAFHAGRSHESMPLRLFWRSPARVPLHAANDPALCLQNIRLLLDRIDMHIEVPAVKYKELRAPSASEDSAAVRQLVIATSGIQPKP
jgi:magnesium chelatase family protein